MLVTRMEGILVLKNRLKELRARDGLNQTQLAKLAKVSRQTISLLERNEYTPSVIIALRIAHIFNEPVENVFSLDEEGEELLEYVKERNIVKGEMPDKVRDFITLQTCSPKDTRFVVQGVLVDD